MAKKKQQPLVIDEKWMINTITETINKLVKLELGKLIEDKIEEHIDSMGDTISDSIKDEIKSDLESDLDDICEEKVEEKMSAITDSLQGIKEAIKI